MNSTLNRSLVTYVTDYIATQRNRDCADEAPPVLITLTSTASSTSDCFNFLDNYPESTYVLFDS